MSRSFVFIFSFVSLRAKDYARLNESSLRKLLGRCLVFILFRQNVVGFSECNCIEVKPKRLVTKYSNSSSLKLVTKLGSLKLDE